jgi:hypothetical protein
MRKALLKLFLTLLIFSVANPVACPAGSFAAEGQITQNKRFTVQDHNSFLVKHLSRAQEFSFRSYVQSQPLWAHTHVGQDDTRVFLLYGKLLFTRQRVPNQRQLYLQLLFPFHFFS